MTSTTTKSTEGPKTFTGYPETHAFLPFRKRYLTGKPTVGKVEFHGTVKIHGCNISIVSSGPEKWQMQSRNRILSAEEDQYDVYATLNDAPWTTLLKQIVRIHDGITKKVKDPAQTSTAGDDDIVKQFSGLTLASDAPYGTGLAQNMNRSDNTSSWEDIMIVGEWAGKGIQKSVGVCELDRFLTIFNISIGKKWQDIRKYKSVSLSSHRIFNICDFPTYSFTVDLTDLTDIDRAEKELAEMVDRVDKECPVAAHFGVKGTGEGIVFTYYPPEPARELHHFKVKGESHVIVRREKVRHVPKEKAARINAFVEYAVTEARLDQGVEYLKEMLIPVEAESTGKYIQWVVGDVLKEEADKLEEIDLTWKDIKFQLTNTIRLGWVTRLREVERS
jgi:hypothetical protein